MISSPLPDLDALDMEALKALVIAQHSELVEHHSNAQEIDRLKLIIEKYRRMIFGRKSEKLTGQLEQLEFRLEELETAQAADEAAQDAKEASQQSPAQTVTTKPRRRPVRKPLGVSERWVRDHATRRFPKLPVVKLGPLLRFRPKDVDEFVERQREDHSGTKRSQ